MTGENIMSYIFVLELSRYGQLKITTNFFECIFRLSQTIRIVCTIQEMTGKVTRSIGTKKSYCSFKQT